MNVARLKNLIRETKEISKRILQELGNCAKPKLQPIPIPIRSNNFHNGRIISTRNYTTCGFGFNQHKPFDNFIKLKFFRFTFKNFTRNFHKNSKILKLIPRSGFYYNHFSQTNNIFRKKLYQSVNTTFWNRLKKMDFPGNAEGAGDRLLVNVRLNLSLTKNNHQLLIRLARQEYVNVDIPQQQIAEQPPAVGCYVEFPVNFSFKIDETILNTDVLDDMLTNIELFQHKLKNLKADLLALFDLGELPIKYDSKKGVIKVYFPNCDYNQLQSLLQEKGVVGGVIVEESLPLLSQEFNFSESDILSSSSGLTEDQSSVSYDDVLSESLPEVHLVRLDALDDVPGFGLEMSEEFHWV